MRTIHDDSPAKADTHTAMQKIFSDFNLAYYLVQYEIISISVESADIRVTQDTRKVSGDLPFRDNRLTAVHTLRRTADGKWKIYYSEMEDVQFLN
jgi:ketosteroid isomerase-like protein